MKLKKRPATPPATAVDIFSSPAAGVWKLPFARPELRFLLQAMLAACAEDPAYLELLLVPDEAMEKLNRKHLRLPGPTNILSFSGSKACLGSLVLAPETARRECFLYGQNPEEHVLRLLAHGLGHLLGRDHGPEMDRLTLLLEKAGLAALAAWREEALWPFPEQAEKTAAANAPGKH